tara:strand:+ start:8043 stop:8177 length:135 start_codon:yes stop_codon:yes gene_type:complete
MSSKDFMIELYRGPDYIVEIPDMLLYGIIGIILLGIYSIISSNK